MSAEKKSGFRLIASQKPEEGVLTVSYPLDRAESENSGGSMPREPRIAWIHSDRANDLAVEVTRILPLVESGLPVGDRNAFARHRGAAANPGRTKSSSGSWNGGAR